MDDIPNGPAARHACVAELAKAVTIKPLAIPNSPFKDRASNMQALQKMLILTMSSFFLTRRRLTTILRTLITSPMMKKKKLAPLFMIPREKMSKINIKLQ